MGKAGTVISQVLASLDPCFYTRSIVRMASRKLTEKLSTSEFNRGIVILIFSQRYPFYPHRPYILHNMWKSFQP